MTDLLLCVVGLFFVAWVLVLKMEIGQLKKEIEKLKSLLKTKLGHVESQVTISNGIRSKGG